MDNVKPPLQEEFDNYCLIGLIMPILNMSAEVFSPKVVYVVSAHNQTNLVFLIICEIHSIELIG